MVSFIECFFSFSDYHPNSILVEFEHEIKLSDYDMEHDKAFKFAHQLEHKEEWM